MRVWIDTLTGTWGTNVEDLVIVDLVHQAELDSDPDEDEYSLLAFLEGASDSEICTFGKNHGHGTEGMFHT
jgi:hypothetical protein